MPRPARSFASPSHRLAMAGILLVSSVACAQNSGISGRVLDGTGAAIQDAEVEVVNVGTSASSLVRSDSAGGYRVVAQQPGRYRLTVVHAGFATLRREGITLDLDSIAHLDLTLAPGSEGDTVTVTADASQLKPDTPSMSTEITEKQYQDLPLVQNNRLRNPASFIYLAPGVQGNVRLDGSEYVGATNVISVNGGPIWNTELLIEGLPGGQTRIVGNFTESSPPVDAVNEFKVTTTLLPADYGHTGFAVGSFNIKSGTNKLHASIFEYLRNTAFNAANWYAKNQGAILSNPPIHQNEFGATIGGPVNIPHLYDGRDRTFFFFGYAGSRFSGATGYGTSTIPSLQQRTPNAAGFYDFSDLKTPVYDPATTVANPSGTGYTRKPFAGNLIPASRIDPVAAKVIAYLPATAATTLGAFQGDILLQPNTYTAKLDHMLTAAQHLSLAWVHTNVPRANLGNALPYPLASGFNQTVDSHTARIVHLWTLRSNLVNQAYIGYNRFENPQTPVGPAGSYPGALGLSGLASKLFPVFSLSGYTPYGNIGQSNKTENDFYYKNNMAWSLGRHNLRFGGEFRAIRLDDLTPSTVTGSFSFRPNETGDPNAPATTGNSFASFLLGQVDSASINTPFKLRTRKTYTGFFLQDDWKASPRLTLNLGLRFEWQGAPREAENHQSIVSLSTPNPGAGNLPGALVFAGSSPVGVGSSTLYATDYTAIGPRFGFAYLLTQHTVLRGGYGVYYTDTMPNADIVNSGFSALGNFGNTSASVNPVFMLANGVPAYSAQQNLTPTAVNGANFSPSFYGPGVGAMPRTQNFSLNLQHQFTPSTLIELSYVGDLNTRQVAPNLVNINQLNPSVLALGQALLISSATPANLAKAGIAAPFPGFSGTIAQALRPYPQYGTLNSVSAKAGSSNYHAGQFLIRQRLAHGLTLNAHYVYSKLLGYASSTLAGNGGSDNSVQNAYDLSVEYGLLSADVRHSAVFNFSYELPFGKNQPFLNGSRLADLVLGGWSGSAIGRYQSGFPFVFSMSNNALPLFNRYQRPNLVAGVDPSTHTPGGAFNPALKSNLFNAAAFISPGSGSFGNAAISYSNLRNYAVLGEDIQLTKRTHLTDSLLWSFYAQAFNPFNRHRLTGFNTAVGATNFGQPSASSSARALQFGIRFEF